MVKNGAEKDLENKENLQSNIIYEEELYEDIEEYVQKDCGDEEDYVKNDYEDIEDTFTHKIDDWVAVLYDKWYIGRILSIVPFRVDFMEQYLPEKFFFLLLLNFVSDSDGQ